MKKIVIIVSVLCLSVSVMTGCGNSSADSQSTISSSETADSQQSSDQSGTTEQSAEEVTEQEPAEQTDISFTELTAVDNDECKIEITDIDPNNAWGFTLNVLLENNSSDKTYMFSVQSASIDGVQSDPFWAEAVAPGKKSNSEISFSNDTLDDLDIMYTDIELTFRVYDNDDWMADDVANETVHVFPYGEESAVRFVRESAEEDTVLIDNDTATIIVTGYEEDPIWGYTVNLYFENKSDANLMFSVADASINGYMADPFFATEVYAGKSEFTSMYWSNDTLEENGITEVEEIEFLMQVYDNDNWSADHLIDEVFTLNP